MIYGLTFNNVHSSTFGLYIKSKQIISPEKNKRKLKIAGRNGSWDFGNETYGDRYINVDFEILAENKGMLRLQIRDVLEWLSGSGKLVFDDEIDKYYTAKVFSQIKPEEIQSDGSFTVQFECNPFAELIYLAHEITDIDNDLLVHSKLRLDDLFQFDVNAPTTVEVNNFGTVPVRPTIKITGSFTTFSITYNEKTLNYNEAISNEEVIIDNENYTVKKGSINKLNVVTGNLNTFLELPKGINNVDISGTGLNCTVVFNFRPMFL